MQSSVPVINIKTIVNEERILIDISILLVGIAYPLCLKWWGKL